MATYRRYTASGTAFPANNKMSRLWLPELKWLIACLAPALVAGYFLGHIYAWLLAAMILFLVIQARKLGRLVQWTANKAGHDEPPPATTGVWGAICSNLTAFRTQLERHEQQLLESNARYKKLTTSLPDAAVVLEDRWRIRWFNTAARISLGLTGRDRGESLLNVVRDPSLARFFESGQYDEPIDIQSPTTRDRFLQIQLLPYSENQFLLVCHDVTRLHRLEQMRTDFVANVSHELRTPLTVLRGCLETIADDAAVSAAGENRRLIDLMQQQTQRMQELVSRLLLLSQLESGTRVATEDRVAVGNLLGTVRRQIEELDAGRHQITWEIDESLGLLGSEVELHSAFSNLAVNAIRYTRDAGTIHIRWFEDTAGACFSVQDSGVGIEQKHLHRITERFYRVAAARRTNSDGTGLGLAIVKHVVMRHDGHLSVDSKPGVGSTFTCTFPPQRTCRFKAGEFKPRASA